MDPVVSIAIIRVFQPPSDRMKILLRRFRILLLASLAGIMLSTATVAAEAEQPLTRDDIDRVLAALEDTERRDEIIETLRALREATGDEKADEQRENVKTAAAELVESVSRKAQEASDSAAQLLDSVNELPTALVAAAVELEDPEVRTKWLTIAWRLLAVLGTALLVAIFLRVLLRRFRPRSAEDDVPMLDRLGKLIWRFLLDLAPIIGLAVTAYGVLTLVDPREETRLVAIALINASVFSRLVIALADSLLAPDSSGLRLWSISDESARYLFRWTKRLGQVSIYGFFGLQAGFLLGLDLAIYESLLRLLGLALLAMLLVLVGQNRRDVAAAIAPDRAESDDEPGAVSSLRKGLARVWHLLTSVYLIGIYVIWALRIEDGASYLLQSTALTVLALAAGRLLSHAIDQGFDRDLKLSDGIGTQFPGLERRLNRYLPALRQLAKLFIAAAVVLLIGYAWGIDTLAWITEGSGRVFVSATLDILLVLTVAFVLWEIASGGIESYLAENVPNASSRARSARTRTLLTVARNALLVVLTVVSSLMILSELGLNIAPLLAGAGVVGLAIGFGAQRLVQDVINGAFILFQDLMSVGDVVKLGDKAGAVEALSIRTVRLRDLEGVVHTIPFSSIEAVSNLTREFSFHVFDIGIAYREDVDEVIALIKSVGEELGSDSEIGPLVLEPIEVFGLDQFGDSAIVIKGRIKTRPLKQWQVGRAFNRLIKLRFDENNIEIPFPHQTIYFGQDKDGSAPPAFVQLEQMLNADRLATAGANSGDGKA
jgi:small conductance mechanosensitive channel